MKTDKMHKVEIDQVIQEFDGQNNLVSEGREEIVSVRIGAPSKFLAAYMALKKVDTKARALNIKTLEVSVDGSSFHG